MKYERSDIPAIADEYVLGLVGDAEAAALEEEMERDGELRAAVAASRERFLPLDSSLEPSPTSEVLWEKIVVNLPPQQAAVRSVSIPPVNDNQPKWRVAALSAIAASLMLAIGLVFALTRAEQPIVIAVLINEAGEVQAVVEDFGNQNATVRLLADFDLPPDKTMQVWTLPSREMGPVSLGLIDGVRSAHLEGVGLPMPHDSQLYEITLEQSGGSPTGRPTGPILAKGLAKRPR